MIYRVKVYVNNISEQTLLQWELFTFVANRLTKMLSVLTFIVHFLRNKEHFGSCSLSDLEPILTILAGSILYGIGTVTIR